MTDFRADLHCHTTCSDGTCSPAEIIELASKCGLQGLSITDHDTIAAYREALYAAEAKKMALISGVELSAVHLGSSVHVLAYSFPVDSPPLTEFCLRRRRSREQRIEKILFLLAKEGMILTEADFPEEIFNLSTHSIGRPHIAAVLVNKGYVSSIQEAFHLFIGEGKSCFVPSSTASVEETIDIIHQANGLAVIAHPHLIGNRKVLNDLLKMNFDGIEGYYARFPTSANEPWLKIGAKKGWIITGGSDFHGTIKPQQPLGSSWVCQETFTLLQQHFLNNQNQQ